MPRWQNWSGGVVCGPVRILSPRTEAELIALLAASDGPFRVAGSGHSFTPRCATDGTLVRERLDPRGRFLNSHLRDLPD